MLCAPSPAKRLRLWETNDVGVIEPPPTCRFLKCFAEGQNQNHLILPQNCDLFYDDAPIAFYT